MGDRLLRLGVLQCDPAPFFEGMDGGDGFHGDNALWLGLPGCAFLPIAGMMEK